MNKVIITSHKHLVKIDDELVKYLNKKPNTIIEHIYHSFSDCADRKSFRKLYQNSSLCKSEESFDYSFFPDFLIYVKEFLFLLKSLIFRKKANLYIALDGLCTFYGLILKNFGLAKKIIFWCIDYVPANRFDSRLLDAIYQKVNKLAIRYSDEVWDLSPRMVEARKKFENIDLSEYKKRKLVPQGVWPNKKRLKKFSSSNKTEIVYLGVLIEKYGIHLIMQALPYLKKTIPSISFKMIGEGHYRKNLELLAKELEIDDCCHFMGRVDRYEEIIDHLAKSAVGVAPYVKKLDTWTYYADPGKIKSYLIAGIPVLLTDIPWNAKEIQSRNCGKIISEDPKEIAKDILNYLTDPFLNQTSRENAFNFGKEFDYKNIFQNMAQV